MIYKCVIYIYILLLVSRSQTHPIRDYTLVWCMKAHLCLRYNGCSVTSASLVNHLKDEIGSYGSCFIIFHN